MMHRILQKTNLHTEDISLWVNCPKFQKRELVIMDIADKINKAGEVLNMAKFAELLLNEVDVLLFCPDYDTKRLDCINCHLVEEVRKQIVSLIIKAKNLSETQTYGMQ